MTGPGWRRRVTRWRSRPTTAALLPSHVRVIQPETTPTGRSQAPTPPETAIERPETTPGTASEVCVICGDPVPAGDPDAACTICRALGDTTR